MVSENLNQQLQSEEQVQPTNQGGQQTTSGQQQPTSQTAEQEQPKKELEPTVAAAMYLLNNDSTRDAMSKYSTDPDELARLLKSDPKIRQEAVKLTNSSYDSFIQKINIDKGLDEFQKKKGINITPSDTAIRTASIYNVSGRNTPTDPITKDKNYSLVDADVSWLPIASGLSSRGDNNDGRKAFVLESDSESNDKETVIYTNDPQFVNIASPGFNFKDSKNPNIEPYTYPDGTVGEVYKIKVPKDFNEKDVIKGELLNQGFNTSMSSRKGLDQSDISTSDVFRASMEKLTGNEITTVFELKEDLNRLKNLYQKGPESKGEAWKKANEEERKRIGEEIKRREAYLENFEKKYYNLDALGVTQDDDYEAVFRKTVAQEEKLGDQSFATYLSNLENLGNNIEKEGRSTLDKLLTGGYAIELIEGLGDDEISQYALATAQKGKIGYFYQRLSDSVSNSLQRVKEEFGDEVHEIVLRGIRGETTDEDLQIIESGQLPVNEAFQYLNNDSKGALSKMSEMAGKIEDIDEMYPKARKIDSDLLKEGIKKDKLGESIGYLGRGALSFGGAVLNIAPSFLGSIQSTVRSAVVGTFNPEKARDLATLGQLVENLNDGFIDFTQNSFNTRELGETVSSGTDSNGVFYEVTYDNEMKPKNVYQNGKRVIFNSSDEQGALIERLQASETIGLPEYQRNTESIVKAGFNSAGDLINTFAFTGGASAILKGTASAAKINSASRFGKVLTSDTAALIAGLNVQYGGRQIEEYINAGVNPRMAILLGLSKSTTEGAIASIFPDFELGRFGLGVSKSSLIRSLSNKSLTSTQKFMEAYKATTRAVGKQLSQEVPEEVLADVITNGQDNLVRSLSEGKVDIGGKIDPLVTAATTIVSVGLTSVGGNLLKNKNISQSTLYTQALRDAALDPRKFGDILATQVAEGQLTEAEAESIQTRLNNLNESVRDVLLDKNGKERSDIPENVKLALIRSADLKNLADNTSEDLSGIPQGFDVLGESAVREAESTVIKQAIEQGKAKELGEYLNKNSTVLGFDEGSPLRSLVHLQNSFKTYSQRVNELKKSLETGIEGTSNARIKKALNRAESLQQYYEILMKASEAGNLIIGEDKKGTVKGIKVTTNAEGKNIVKLEGTDEEIQISDDTKDLFALGSNEVLRQIKNDLEALTAREIIENDDDIAAEEKVVKDNSLEDAPESGSVRTTLPGKKVEGNFVKEGGRWYIKDNEGGLHPVSVKNFKDLDQALLDSKKKPSDKVEEAPADTTEEAPTVATEEAVATPTPSEVTAETTDNVLYETPRQRVIEKDGQRVAQHKKGDEWIDYKNQDGIAAKTLFNNVPEQVAETDSEVEAETTTEQVVSVDETTETPQAEVENPALKDVESTTKALEEKKVDIERRKQEELKNPVKKTSSFLSSEGKEEDAIYLGEKYLIEVFRGAFKTKYSVEVSQKDDTVSTGYKYNESLSKNSFDTYEEALEYANKVARKDKEYQNKINAKYDAEIKALEESLDTKPASEPVTDALKDVESTAKALEGVDKNKLPQISTKSVTETQNEYIEKQKKEMGNLYSENMLGELKNEYFNNIEQTIKNGGKISLYAYNSLDGGQKYTFDKRYGKSKIGGETLYHSTNKEFDSFDLSKSGTTTDNGWWGKGVYFFKDKKSANDFSLRNKNSVVKTATVNLKNPLILENESLPKNVIEAFNKRGIKAETIWDIQSYALEDMNKNPERITEILMSLDYDGIHLDLFPNKEVLVFNTSSIDKPINEAISEAYHKAKADGSNPELVKAVEELLGKPTPPTEATTEEVATPTEAKSEARQIKEKVQEEGGDQKQLIEELSKSDAIPSVAVTSMNVDDITVDPERFQFKIGLDPETGVSDSLKSASKFDKRKDNVISVWKDPKDGKTYVINGHHRLDLAKRKGVKTINVMVLDEQTESQARYVGAMQNLSEGMGSATDAAKMFRESGITELEQALPLLETEGLATTDNKVQTAISLAALSEPLFDLVVKGEISENVGAVIGRHIKSKPIQEQFYREQVKGKRTNLRDLKIMAQDVGAAPKETVVELSLFGETETEKAAYRDRVSVISGVRASIGKAKNLLKKVAKDSDFLAEFGNKIDAEKSEGAANDAAIALAIFDSLRNTNPEIKKIIDDATKRIQDGETKSRAIAKAAREIQNSLERIYDESFGKGTTTRSDQPKSDESETTTEVEAPVEASIPESEKKEIAERIGEVRKVKAKNLKGLLDVMGSIFGLNKEQSESAAVIGDVLVETMAKRAGISKDAMYARIAFQKSTMEELMKLSEKGKQLFQIVGENAQLGETIKENLQVARDMESAGKDAKTIRMATGWEKGKDGKWRYEILDGELKGWAKKDTDEGYSSNFETNLESVLENEELFKAYPSLRKIKVEFKDGNNTGSFSGGKITVSSNANNKKSILLHEIQHAIQDIEGFAKGGKVLIYYG
jgi:hypothetical protein